ncbi:hypothetical protein JCM19029_19570 [Salinicoccus sesuvii]
MRPPMHQKIWHKAETDNGDTDRYGDPIMTEKTLDYDARVRRESNVIQKPDGTTVDTNLEIDVPAEAQVKAGQDIEYVDIEGNEGAGRIEDIKESTNLSATKVYFKVLMVDGT